MGNLGGILTRCRLVMHTIKCIPSTQLGLIHMVYMVYVSQELLFLDLSVKFLYLFFRETRFVKELKSGVSSEKMTIVSGQLGKKARYRVSSSSIIV